MVSISDVAKRAGVSPTTVSHTLSGKRKVGDEVRAKVHEAMAALHYVPARSAQNLALGVTRVLALVVPDIGIEYFAELAKGVERTAVDRGYNLILASTGFDSEREARYLEMINSRAVDGIVYAAGAPLEVRERDALLGGLPLVLVDEEVAGAELTTVVSDNEEGGRLVAAHLLALGHRSALVVGIEKSPVSSIRRTAGFEAAWTAEGGKMIQDLGGDYSDRSGHEVAERYVDSFRSGEITAVFAHNDLMALGVINALRRQGVSVPGDVSVVGFDDVSPGRYSFPALTTVRQDVGALGTIATTALLDSLESKEPLGTERSLLPVELVVRESTGEVAAR